MKTIVVGAGAAGLWCALHAADGGPVTLVAPDPQAGSATALAQGGIAAAVAEGDDPQAHAADTLTAGAGLSDPEAVGVLTREASTAIGELRMRGMRFDAEGAPTLEGGHSARRVLHAGGDATGWAILQALLGQVRADPRVEWVDARATGLVTEDRRVVGVQTGAGSEALGDRVVLATGGACGIYGRRTGPDRAVGEGMALAWNAGAALADLEFVQFHPTALDVPGSPARLLTEALRGEGAVLVDADGNRFMPRFDERAELAPRDVVARAVAAVREQTGRPVSLDATAIEGVRERFPTAGRTCAEVGLDLARDRIPVAPAAHYFTGGVLTDTWGRTSVPGLSACGEVACTGIHGANRLASNSLLEAVVFGRRAALAEDGEVRLDRHYEALEEDLPGRGLPLEEIRALADGALGVIRNGSDLEATAGKLAGADQPDGHPAATLTAWLVARAALRREESRGGHYRSDFPEPRPEWRLRQKVSVEGWARLPVRG
ncbi:MAG: L-aspartate oxidase [Actinomycetota bacterium]